MTMIMREKFKTLKKKNANTKNLTRKWHFNSTLSKLLNIMFYWPFILTNYPQLSLLFFLFITGISKLIRKIKEEENKVHCFQS